MRGRDLCTWIILETESGVRVMRWCLRGRSKRELREANSGKDVGVGEDERMGKYVSGRNNMVFMFVKWDGKALKKWTDGRNVLSVVSLFFLSVCFVCLWIHSWVWACFPVVAFASCPLAHVDLCRLPRCLWGVTLYVDSLHISTSVCRCEWGSSRGVWRGAVQ